MGEWGTFDVIPPNHKSQSVLPCQMVEAEVLYDIVETVEEVN